MPAPQSRDWPAPHSWCFWVSRPCPRRRLRAPTPSRGNYSRVSCAVGDTRLGLVSRIAAGVTLLNR